MTCKADIWSFGLLIHDIFSDSWPFPCTRGAAAEMDVLASEGKLVPTKLPADCPCLFQLVCDACFAQDEATRPDAKAVLAMLSPSTNPVASPSTSIVPVPVDSKASSATTERDARLRSMAKAIAAASAATQAHVPVVLGLLRRILSAIVNHPTEVKFRKLSIEKVCVFGAVLVHLPPVQLLPKFEGVRGAIQFLEVAGFKRTPSASPTHLALDDSVQIEAVQAALQALPSA